MAIRTKFDHLHYVPILRYKPAEMQALRYLLSEDKQRMTPLLELLPNIIVPKNIKDPRENLFTEGAKQIALCWGHSPFFVDVELMYTVYEESETNHYLRQFCEVASRFKLHVIPVTGLHRSQYYQTAVEKIVTSDNRGVCIRLLEHDLYNPSLERGLQQLLARLRLRPEQVHILVDFKIVDGECMSFVDLCSRIPSPSSWRTFTVAGGAFPEDLSDFEKNNQYELSRREWMHWLDQIKNGPKLSRYPTFGDYTIQHPVYVKRTGFLNPSASIRYTSEDYWVIMRGEGVLNDDGPGYKQYWANANLLSKRKEFCGPNFSNGDEYIYEIGQQTEDTGNARTWIQAGINHHLTFVVRQIASSFASSSDGVPGPESGQGLLLQQALRTPSHEASGAGLRPRQLPLIK